MATKYTNPIKITSARSIGVQQPVDDRTYFDEIGNITDSIVADEHYKWHADIIVYVREIHQMCAWLDSSTLPAGITNNDLLPNTTGTYPNGYPNVNYENKTFGFYILRAIAITHTHTENEITDLDKYTQSEIAAFLATKQSILPANGTGQVALLQKNAANDTFSWVILTFLNAPTNTGHVYGFKGTTWYIIQDSVVNPIVASTNPAPGDPTESKIPVHVVYAGGYDYTLEDPSTMPTGYILIITHDGVSSSPVNMNGWQIDDIAPFPIPQGKSIIIGVIDNKWRALNSM